MSFHGTIKAIIYQDLETSFYIFSVEDSATHKTKKCKGTFVLDSPTPGMQVVLNGAWEDTKWGPTLNVTSLSVPIPESTYGLIQYLQGHVRYIGPVLANRLVSHFGTDVIHVLDHEPHRLEEIERLSARARVELLEAWAEERSYRQLAVALLRTGLSKVLVKAAYTAWGDDALARLEANPYQIMTLPGAGFGIADKLALGFGIALDARPRIEGVILHVLDKASKGAGHLYLSYKDLVVHMSGVFRKESIPPFGRVLTRTEVIDALKSLQSQEHIVCEGTRIYLKPLHFVEAESAKSLLTMLEAPTPLSEEGVEAFVTQYERIQDLALSPQQRAAIYALTRHPVLMVTGLPGSGKTTVSRALVKLLLGANLSVELVSPTGIAAKRLSTVVGFPASTIHRALGYRGEGTWHHDENNPLAAQAVLVDEFSMVDQTLLYRLLKALKPGTILICVGDHAQLPSVGAGNVLHDMIRSGTVPRVHLTQIFRQGQESGIVRAAHSINEGGTPELIYEDFQFVSSEGDSKTVEIIKTFIGGIQKKASKGTTFQVLSPRWAGTLGVDNLNTQLREVLNPNKGQKFASVGDGVTWRVGDRVIVMANDYELGVFNGEQGTVVDIDTHAKEIQVRIRDAHTKVIAFPYKSSRRMLKLAFCITIHRSQGNEWDYVVMPFVKAYGHQLQRNLLYTAVTRAKKRVVMLGEWGAVAKAVANNEVVQRNTYFAQRLQP